MIDDDKKEQAPAEEPPRKLTPTGAPVDERFANPPPPAREDTAARRPKSEAAAQGGGEPQHQDPGEPPHPIFDREVDEYEREQAAEPPEGKGAPNVEKNHRRKTSGTKTRRHR